MDNDLTLLLDEPNFKYALKYFKKHDFQKSEEFFLKLIPQYIDDVDLYYYVALCNIKLKKINQAADYIEKGLDLDPVDSRLLMTGAYVDLFLNKESHAIYKYSKLINHKIKVKRVTAILDKLKTEGISELLFNKNIHFFLYDRPFGFLPQKSFYFIISILVVGILFYLFIPSDVSKLNKIDGLIYINTNFINGNVQVRSLKDIYLFEDMAIGSKKISSGQLVKLFNLMKEAIVEKRINDAIIINNKILFSDANSLIKEKFNILGKCIPKPNFTDFKDSITFEEIAGDDIYRNIYIKRRGIISDIKKNSDDLIFNFSVLKEEKIEYTVEVIVQNLISSSFIEGALYEILGKYRLFDRHKKKMIIEGLVIKKI